MIYIPGPTKMFQFEPFPALQLLVLRLVYCRLSDVTSDGLPHSETAGSEVHGTSPTSIAAVCVFPRSQSPRHPLMALWVDFVFVPNYTGLDKTNIQNIVKTIKWTSLHLLKSSLSSLGHTPFPLGKVRSNQLIFLKKPSLTGGLVPKNKLSLKLQLASN